METSHAARERKKFTKRPQSRALGWGHCVGLLLLCLLASGCSSVTLTAVDGGPDAGPDGGNLAVILTVSDYLNWCNVTVDGDGGYMPQAAFVLGTVVDLDASPKTGYVWGYWTGTDGDTGSGDPNLATTVTMNVSKEVVACCPQSPPAAQICPTPMP
jgi:Divergent InlB B-repeat domain